MQSGEPSASNIFKFSVSPASYDSSELLIPRLLESLFMKFYFSDNKTRLVESRVEKLHQSLSTLIRTFDDVFFILFHHPACPAIGGALLEHAEFAELNIISFAVEGPR